MRRLNAEADLLLLLYLHVRCGGWELEAPPKSQISHIDASLSRQPLVKGERLVRYEVNAVIQSTALPRDA